MKKTIISSTYMGPLEWWASLLEKQEIILECHEHYQKKSFRNKSEIFGSAGVVLLSVPLRKGKHGGIKIREVLISYDENWQKLHLKKIEDAYIKAPYYEHYMDELRIILRSNQKYLFDLNLQLYSWFTEKMNLELIIHESQDYNHNYEGFQDLRNLGSNNKKKFTISERSYPQVFEHTFGFQANISILDLLMNQGPESKVYLKEINKLMT